MTSFREMREKLEQLRGQSALTRAAEVVDRQQSPLRVMLEMLEKQHGQDRRNS